MNDVIRLFGTLAVLDLVLVPFFVVVSALFPKRVLKTQGNIDLMPGGSFTLGLVNFVFFFAIALVLFILSEKMGDLLKVILIVPAVVILALLTIALSLGLAGMVNLIGERVTPAQHPWRRTLWGTLLLGVACAVPFVGWFLLLPYAGWVGVGAFIFSFFQPDRPPLPKE
jgi:hypothetical protein